MTANKWRLFNIVLITLYIFEEMSIKNKPCFFFIMMLYCMLGAFS